MDVDDRLVSSFGDCNDTGGVSKAGGAGGTYLREVERHMAVIWLTNW